MHQIHRLQILIFSMHDQEFAFHLDYVLFTFSFLKSLKIIIFVLFCYICSILHTSSLLISHAYVSIESIDCILLKSLELYSILLTSSVSTLCFPLLNLCWNFSINLLFFMNFYEFSHTLSMSSLVFWVVYFFFKLICFYTIL